MSKKKFNLFGFFFTILFLVLSACSNPLAVLPEEETPPTELNTTYVDSVLAQLRTDLTGSSSVARISSTWDNNLTASEIDAIIAAARSKIEDNSLLESTNLSAFLPLIIEGAQSQIGKTSGASTTSVKMNVIETMISSSIRIIDNEISSEVGKTSLIVSVTETVVKNIPLAGVEADEIDDVAGGALSIVTSTTESIFTIDSISNVVSSIASTSIQALSVAYNSVGMATGDDVSTGVSVVTGAILGQIQSFASLEGNALGDTLVNITGSINSSLGILAGNLDSNAVSGSVSISGLAGNVISTVTEKLLSVGSTDDTEFIKDMVSDTITALSGESGDLSAFASEITSVAVQSAAAAASGDPTEVITGIVETVAEAVTVLDTEGTIVLTDIITETNTGLDPATLGDAIADGVTAAENNAPEITSLILSDNYITADPNSSLSVIAIVSADDIDGDPLTYFWDISSALAIESGNGTAIATIKVPDFTGDFRITAKVSDGNKSTTKTIYLTVQPDDSETAEEAADRLVLEGKNSLSLGNYTEALNLFAEAMDKDSSNDEAALFWAYLNLGSAIVDPVVQQVAANAGFIGYPETMEEFIAGDWTSAMPVSNGVSYYYDGDGNLYQTDVYTSLFPEIEIPEGMNSIPYYDIALQDSEQLTWGEYMNALANNLQKNYPDGFNTPVSSVVTFLKNNLDNTANALSSISGSDSISLEPEMFIGGDFDPFTSIWPTDIEGNPEPIIVGEAEALLSMAAIQIINSLLNSVLAVDLSIDLAAFYAAMNLSDGIFWDDDYLANQRGYDWNDALESAYDWSSLPEHPLASGFLQTSVNAGTVLAESKQYMSEALINLASAVDGFQARDGVTSSFTFSETEMGTDNWDSFMEIVDISGILVDKMSASLTNGTSFIVPLEIFTGEFSNYATNWPSTENWTGVTTFDDLSSAVMEVNLSVLYDKPVLALDNLIELDSNGEPIIYSEEDGSFTAISSYDADQVAIDKAAGKKYAFKIKDITFGGLINIPASVVSDLITDSQQPTYINEALNQVIEGSAISYYINIIEPRAVFSALNPIGSLSDPDPESENYVKATGSFWYAMIPMVEAKQERILDNNDTVDEAEALVIGDIALDRTLTYHDVDYYSVVVNPFNYYRITITAEDNTGVYLSVEDSNYMYYGSNSFNMTAGESYSLIFDTYDISEISTLSIKVEDSYEWEEKGYSIEIDVESPAVDGNDSITEAVTLATDGSILTGNLEPVDTDYYAVELTAGNVYKFQMETAEWENYEIVLIDNSEYQVAWSNNYSEGIGYLIYYTCEASGFYYLKINDNYVNDPITFDLSASIIVIPDDGSNDYASAISLNPGDVASAGDLTIMDSDYYSFTGTAGRTYTIYMDSEDEFYTYVQVENSSFESIASDSAFFSDGFVLTFQVDADDTYYIHFENNLNDEQVYSYNISLTEY